MEANSANQVNESEEEYVLLDLDSVYGQLDIPPNAPYVLSSPSARTPTRAGARVPSRIGAQGPSHTLESNRWRNHWPRYLTQAPALLGDEAVLARSIGLHHGIDNDIDRRIGGRLLVLD
ncbi:hypothetical protein TIFTF001_013980 [Ficus carica]|uniref:Uncharacterized protein n=1 Tax=Ficus carica TaxID=3494 RepID=A0AA88A1X7_FICCA|nr:hypothetical protein TIFTF001_013980 [Ficus carica]